MSYEGSHEDETYETFRLVNRQHIEARKVLGLLAIEHEALAEASKKRTEAEIVARGVINQLPKGQRKPYFDEILAYSGLGPAFKKPEDYSDCVD